MKISIITKEATGIFKALVNMGYRDLQSIPWLRTPFRINGVWHATVHHA